MWDFSLITPGSVTEMHLCSQQVSFRFVSVFVLKSDKLHDNMHGLICLLFFLYLRKKSIYRTFC